MTWALAREHSLPRVRTGELIDRGDGTTIAVLAVSGPDAASADPVAVARTHRGWVAALRCLTGPAQVIVRGRHRLPQAAIGGSGDRADLRAMLDEHDQSHLKRRVPLSRATYLVLSGTDERALDAQRDSVMRHLATGAVSASPVTGADLADYISEMSGPWTECLRHAQHGNRAFAGIALTRYPSLPVTTDWFAEVLSIDAEFDLAIHLAPVAVAHATHRLRRTLREQAARTLHAQSGRDVLLDSDRSGQDAATLWHSLAQNETRALDIAVVAMARGVTPEAATDARRRLAEAWEVAGCSTRGLYGEHHSAAIAVAPLALCSVNAWKLSDSICAATLLMTTTRDRIDEGGYRLGHERRSGMPVTVNPFGGNAGTNANVAVIAASGQGKSYTLGTIIIEATRTRRPVTVLDPEGEHRRLIDCLGGEYFDLSPSSPHGVNILDCGVSVHETASITGELVSILIGDLTANERLDVEQATVACLNCSSGSATLMDVVKRLGSGTRVAVHLRRIIESPGGLLVAGRSMAGLGDVVGIGLRDVPEALTPAVAFAVSQWLWTDIRRRTVERHLVVDEVGLLLAVPQLRRLLVELSRRCRKYGASLVIATQNAGDLMAGGDVTVLATNAATVLLGGQRPADSRVMAEAFGLTARQEARIGASSRGEFLLITGEDRVEITVDIPPGYIDMITPAGSRDIPRTKPRIALLPDPGGG